jgi:NTP pyrophosphatase (non-canonical NTP hydrolase)
MTLVGYVNLDELVSTSYEIAKSKGWWDKPRSFAALTLLMQSEISEALEDYRSNKGLNEVWYENAKSKAPRCHCGTDHGEGCEMHHYLMPDGHCTCYVTHKKPCGIPSELADVVIRVADFCGHHKLVLSPASKSIIGQKDFEQALAESAACISDAYRDLSKIDTKVQDLWYSGSFGVSVSFSLSKAVEHLLFTCEANDINIWKAIEEKTAFNRTRPERHGNKKV